MAARIFLAVLTLLIAASPASARVVLESHDKTFGYDPGLYRQCASTQGKPDDQNFWTERAGCISDEAGWLAVVNSERTAGVSCGTGPLNRSYVPNEPDGVAGIEWKQERGFGYAVTLTADSDAERKDCGDDMWHFVALYDRLERGAIFPEPSRLVTEYKAKWNITGAARIILGATFASADDMKRYVLELNLASTLPLSPIAADGSVVKSMDWYGNGRTEFVLLDADHFNEDSLIDWSQYLSFFSRQPDRVQSVYFGIEATDGRAELTMNDYETLRR